MKYDHNLLKAGDVAYYGNRLGMRHSWTFAKSKVEKLTATQIVLENGKRFRRSDGGAVGSKYRAQLLDPVGEEVRDAKAQLEAQNFGYALMQWEKSKRDVTTLIAWEVALAQLEALVLDAQCEIQRIKGEHHG